MFGIENSQVIVDFSNFNVTSLGQAFLYGGTILLIGMATIFLVLSTLWLSLVLFKVVFHDIPERKKNKAAVNVADTPSEDVSTANDGEIIAVIAAAIAMAESEANGVKFQVVSFKRK